MVIVLTLLSPIILCMALWAVVFAYSILELLLKSICVIVRGYAPADVKDNEIIEMPEHDRSFDEK